MPAVGGKINETGSIWFYDNHMRLGHLTVKLFSGDESQKSPVIKGFIKDDLTISIANTWGTVDGYINENS
jgi:hypothetical protein